MYWKTIAIDLLFIYPSQADKLFHSRVMSTDNGPEWDQSGFLDPGHHTGLDLYRNTISGKQRDNCYSPSAAGRRDTEPQQSMYLLLYGCRQLLLAGFPLFHHQRLRSPPSPHCHHITATYASKVGYITSIVFYQQKLIHGKMLTTPDSRRLIIQLRIKYAQCSRTEQQY